MDNRFAWARDHLKTVERFWAEAAYDQARMVIRSILIEEPGFARAHAYAGWDAQYQLEDLKLARFHYELALVFDPSDAYAYLHFAELLIAQKDEARMRSLLREGVKYETVDKATLYNDCGRLLEVLGKNQEAARLYRAAMKYTMNYFVLQTLRANRKRARYKYRLFDMWVGQFL